MSKGQGHKVKQPNVSKIHNAKNVECKRALIVIVAQYKWHGEWA